MLLKLRNENTSAEQKMDELGAEISDRRNDVTTFSVEKGKLEKPLDDLRAQDQEFAGFTEELERAALGNLRNEIRGLETQIASAEGESREKARQRVTFFAERVKDKEQTIQRFDQLVITALRKNFSDQELNTAFRLLNRDLLELPMGKDGVVIARKDELIATLQGLLAKVRDGIYSDAMVSFRLPNAGEPLAGLDNPDTAREQLAEYQATLKRWTEVLAAIEQPRKTRGAAQVHAREVYGKLGRNGEILAEGKERKLFRYEGYQKAKAEEPRLELELKKIEECIAAANERIQKLALNFKQAEKAKTTAEWCDC